MIVCIHGIYYVLWGVHTYYTSIRGRPVVTILLILT